jgi:hypothetical protein
MSPEIAVPFKMLPKVFFFLTFIIIIIIIAHFLKQIPALSLPEYFIFHCFILSSATFICYFLSASLSLASSHSTI